jgi:pimeloyl-ACP methyl ester carboxylesterase
MNVARRRSALCGMAVALALTMTEASPIPSIAAETERCVDPGTALPVVLVHGFTGSKTTMRQLADELDGHRVDFMPVLFDYEDTNTRWVDHESIAPRLRRLIACLADASQKTGGIGRVAVVAHSMGGLATRLALAPTADDSRGSLSEEVVFVATLGTPHTGSPWAGPSVDSKLKIFRSAYTAIAHGLGPIGFPRLDNEAGKALAIGSAQLTALPDFPEDVAVLASAGEFVGTSRMLFYSRQDRFGDIIVSSSSTTYKKRKVDRLGGVDVVECETLLPLDLGVAGVTAAMELTLRTNPTFLDCYHGALPTSRQHLDVLIAQLSAASTRPARQVTEVVEVVPIDTSGNPTPEYTVEPRNQTVDCSYAEPSPSSVGTDIAWCGGTADAADVCWVLSDRITLLCGHDPWEQVLYELQADAPVDAIAANPDPLPWALELANGMRCRLRIGGAWGGRSDGLIGWYGCGTDARVVLGPQEGPPIDQSQAAWTVQIGELGEPDQEFPTPEQIDITVAYFASSP